MKLMAGEISEVMGDEPNTGRTRKIKIKVP